MTENRPVVAQGKKYGELFGIRDTRELSGIMGSFPVFTVVIITQG